MLRADQLNSNRIYIDVFDCRLLRTWSSWRILRQDGSFAWARWPEGWHKITTSNSSAFKSLRITLGTIITMRTWPTNNVCVNFLAAGFSYRYSWKDVTINHTRKTPVPLITLRINVDMMVEEICYIIWPHGSSFMSLICMFARRAHSDTEHSWIAFY